MTQPGPVEVAIARLDRWLEGMRGPEGYAGPVVHWWRDSLIYCGPGLDWRYEGIIDGYLTLFERTSHVEFLRKAKRAGEDLVRGQLPDGTFRNSSFERNPRAGGTPHEAAADVGLLRLATTLRGQEDDAWPRYVEVARRNVDGALIGRLWSDVEQRFGDGGRWFVPNKAATIVEALCLLAEVSGRDEYVARYVVPTTDAILAHQIDAPGGALDGAIAQASQGNRLIERYFPYYNARSIPGLCAAHRVVGDDRYLAGALRAASFVMRWQDPDGGWPQVIYSARRLNRYPRWIAGAGDVVRAFELLRPHGLAWDIARTIGWILGGQLPSGAIRAAHGFRSRATQRPPGVVPEVRDVLPVVGWNDKAFRSLAHLATVAVDAPPASPTELDCSWNGRSVRYREDRDGVRITRGRSILYSWQKSRSWADWSAPEADRGR